MRWIKGSERQPPAEGWMHVRSPRMHPDINYYKPERPFPKDWEWLDESPQPVPAPKVEKEDDNQKCICPDFFGSHADCAFSNCNYMTAAATPEREEPREMPSSELDWLKQGTRTKEIARLRDQLTEITNDRDVYKEWWGRSQASVASLTSQLEVMQGERDALVNVIRQVREKDPNGFQWLPPEVRGLVIEILKKHPKQ